MRNLAVLIPVWNEEALLQGCLDSAKLISDHIFVADGAFRLYGHGLSSDKTMQIAYLNQCHVSEKVVWETEAWKRESLVKSTYNYNELLWCLFLDADERLEFPSGPTAFQHWFRPENFDPELKWMNINIWRPEHKHHPQGFLLPRFLKISPYLNFRPPMDYTVYYQNERIAYLDGETVPDHKKQWFLNVPKDLIRIRHDRHLRTPERTKMSGEYQQKRRNEKPKS